MALVGTNFGKFHFPFLIIDGAKNDNKKQEWKKLI
jgi:hypothetical protein